jgi:hypothetical protein
MPAVAGAEASSLIRPIIHSWWPEVGVDLDPAMAQGYPTRPTTTDKPPLLEARPITINLQAGAMGKVERSVKTPAITEALAGVDSSEMAEPIMKPGEVIK